MRVSHWMTSVTKHEADPSEPYQLCVWPRGLNRLNSVLFSVFCGGLVATSSLSNSIPGGGQGEHIKKREICTPTKDVKFTSARSVREDEFISE